MLRVGTMTAFMTELNGYLWGFPMIAFLLFTHLFFTYKTKFVQKKLLRGIKLSLKGDSTQSNISPFQTLCTTLASTLGTGNIIGVATAVGLGGAGAVFWCFITGILGMATMYCESFLSLKYRVKSADGRYKGGPMYYMTKGMRSRKTGIFYGLCASLGGLITGSALQGNAITTALYGFLKVPKSHSAFDINIITLVTALLVIILTAFVIMGGVKSVGNVCQIIVPFMAIVYILASIGVLIVNGEYVVDAVVLIIKSAFSPQAAVGGFVGSSVMSACRFGISRGLFSNEAGAGTTAVVSAAAEGKNFGKLSLGAMTAAFWDTAVMCSVTGIIIVSAMLANPQAAADSAPEMLASFAFDTLPIFGRPVLFFGLVTFAFSTIIGWSYIGENCFSFVFGEKRVRTYRLLWIAMAGVSVMLNSELMWSFADTVNILLVLPNTVSLYKLRNEIE